MIRNMKRYADAVAMRSKANVRIRIEKNFDNDEVLYIINGRFPFNIVFSVSKDRYSGLYSSMNESSRKMYNGRDEQSVKRSIRRMVRKYA